jgi:thiamine-monophosphate kinase
VIVRRSKLLPELHSGGDDYEILCSVKSGHESAFENTAMAAGVLVTRIGEIASSGGEVTVIGSDGALTTPEQRGYEHFR